MKQTTPAPSEGLIKEAEETMIEENFDKVPDGEWVQPIRKGYRMQCCDCGLIHTANFRIRKGRIQFQMTREPHTLEDVQDRMESRKVTFNGKSWLDWHQHIDSLFAAANPGEDIPFNAILAWPGEISEADRAWATQEIAKSLAPVEATGPACMDCDRPYPYGLDTVLTRKQWLMIAPGDGLLCASCIVDRAKKLPGSIAVYAHIVLNEHYDKEDSLENILIALRLENADYARENAEMKHEVEAIGSETATDSVSAEEFLKLSARLTNSKRLLERHWQLDQGCPCQLCIETREFLENES